MPSSRCWWIARHHEEVHIGVLQWRDTSPRPPRIKQKYGTSCPRDQGIRRISAGLRITLTADLRAFIVASRAPPSSPHLEGMMSATAPGSASAAASHLASDNATANR